MNKLAILITSLLLGSLFVDVYSQSNVKQWIATIEKAETDGVDVTVIQRRNEKTKKLEHDFYSLVFTATKNEALIKSYEAAAAKDKKDAIKISDTKRRGRIVSQILEFYDQKTNLTTKVIFSMSNIGRVTISLTAREREGG